jgi:hypothetical protein
MTVDVCFSYIALCFCLCAFLLVILLHEPMCLCCVLYEIEGLYLVFHSMFVRSMFVREFILTLNGFRLQLC